MLRDSHRPARDEAELARRLLLQARGDERRGREAPALLALDLLDPPGGAAQAVDECARRLAGLDMERGRIELLVADADQSRRERRRLAAVELGGDRPVLDFLERLDLPLTLADDPHRHRLHPAGGKAAAHLLPEQRADLVTDQAIENAAGLLRLEQ